MLKLPGHVHRCRMCDTMTPMKKRSARPGVICAVLAVVGVGFAGCAADQADRSAVAAAKCSLPVDEKAGFSTTPTGTTADKEGVTVTNLGEGRYRVTGQAVGHGENGHVRTVDFTCEVAPDASDKLRGFKVTSLTITPQ